MTVAAAILSFYQQLNISFILPEAVEVMNPFKNKEGWKLTEAFYNRFYTDTNPRTYIIGINPGRFGGGVTGIPFTDPIRLQEQCGINNDLKKLPELSSDFIYRMINACGGVDTFYSKYFITAVVPLGFVKEGKNLNYYDDKKLLKACEPFVAECMQKQQQTIPTGSTCYILGEGENYKQFSRMNDKYSFFENIIALPHPRWIMQYRRKRLEEYIRLYADKLGEME